MAVPSIVDMILQRISTPEGLNATARQLRGVAPPTGLDNTIRDAVTPPELRAPVGTGGATPAANPLAGGQLGMALLGQQQQAGTVAPPVPAPFVPPAATVPGQFVLRAPQGTPAPQSLLARALMGG